MHVLATQPVGLEEAEVAVDLGQTPADVVVLSFSDSDLSALASAWQQAAGVLPTLRLASLKQLRHPMSVDLYLERVISKARVVIVRCLGGLDYWRYGLERIADAAREQGILFAALPGDDREDTRLAAMSTLGADKLSLLSRFFREGGSANLEQALRYVGSLLGHSMEWIGPVSLGPMTILGKDQSDRPVALIVFYRALLVAGDMAPVTALAEALDREGLEPVSVAISSLKDPAIANDLMRLIESRRPAVILNATAFSALRANDTTVLDAADVPVLQVVLSGSTEDAWQQSGRGLAPADLAMNVVLPELDGRLLTRAISFKGETPIDPRLEFAAIRHIPKQDRVDYVARLARAWARLQQTPRQDRRVALVLSDYPARGGRAGYAVGLDTVASTEEILSQLGAEGYDTAVEPNAVAALLNASSDCISIPLDFYRQWLETLPGALREALWSNWGEPQGEMRVPVLRCGKVLVLLQPDRGSADDRKSGYHDTSRPPQHVYVALYAWLREVERIDALVHLGTHGTLEWLPGKALALSSECWPEIVLGPLPVIYPFIVNNPGEAMQAKRRLGAVTIGHLTPPLGDAGLHGALAEMEGIIEEYAAADGLDARRLRHLEEEIVDRAWSNGLAIDCGLVRGQPAREAVAKLDAQLCDIKELAVRDGLHVFGRPPETRQMGGLARAIGVSEEAIRVCAQRERQALLAALDGRRIAPGPAGAPTRGRADVLPTGRNLTAIDPRAIPTQTATAIGGRAAAEVIRRYLQDHGDYPRNLVIDLWASASLRTGGDDLAQALAYLGVRPNWDASSSRVVGVEVLPLAVLDRPRIDVTLRISGLFRDIFESQIALFDLAVRKVADLDEPAADNPLAEVRRANGDLGRIFGAAPGAYGAQAGDVALDGVWQSREDLGAAYLAGVTHAYGGVEPMRLAGGNFKERVSEADLLIHPQDDRERDVLDGDGVADFAGGFAAAAALMGNTPELYHLDTGSPDSPRVRRLAEEVARIVRGRLTNPRWLQGMLAHGHRGVAEIAQGVDALYAFAALTSQVPGHLFDAVHVALFADGAVIEAMTMANPAATQAIIDRLRDARARGLWVTRRNAVAEDLRGTAGGLS